MSELKKYLLTIAYDGSSYAGWQTQANGLSVQTLIEKTLATILRHPTPLVGSGRTDSGVHALAQTAHFSSPLSITEADLLYRLNRLLPSSVRILKLMQVPEDFHARFSVIKKTYRYLIWHHPVMDPFLNKQAWHIPYPLDYDLLQQATQKLQGQHDFKAFAAKNHLGPASIDSLRHLESFTMSLQGPLISFELTSKGFLYKMVRNLVGCAIAISSQKLPLEIIDSAFQTGSRHLIGATAPPHGLYLKQVYY